MSFTSLQALFQVNTVVGRVTSRYLRTSTPDITPPMLSLDLQLAFKHITGLESFSAAYVHCVKLCEELANDSGPGQLTCTAWPGAA